MVYIPMRVIGVYSCKEGVGVVFEKSSDISGKTTIRYIYMKETEKELPVTEKNGKFYINTDNVEEELIEQYNCNNSES